MCDISGFTFIDDDIPRSSLAGDNVHLNEEEKVTLANNILSSLNDMR